MFPCSSQIIIVNYSPFLISVEHLAIRSGAAIAYMGHRSDIVGEHLLFCAKSTMRTEQQGAEHTCSFCVAMVKANPAIRNTKFNKQGNMQNGPGHYTCGRSQAPYKSLMHSLQQLMGTPANI
jgi:hypothetical protein